jgi:HEPN domain-containing protein
VAKSIASGYREVEHVEWMKKIQLLLQYLPPQLPPELKRIEFLPTSPCPSYFPLPWRADTLEKKLAAPSDLLYRENSIFLGHTNLVLNTLSPEEGGCGTLSSPVLKAMGISDTVGIMKPVNTLSALIHKHEEEDIDDAVIDEIVKSIYEYLQRCQEKFPAELLDIACVWTEGSFVKPKFVTKQWPTSGPFLFPYPATMTHRLRTLLNIPSEFPVETLLNVLQTLYLSKNGTELSDNEFELVRAIISQLQKKCNEIPKTTSVPLPDGHRVLQYAKELTYHDVTWQSRKEGINYVSDEVLPSFALKLGVNTGRSVLASKYFVSMQPFGQHEELTTRLSGILKDYKYDVTLLKELIQNAEDAKATKLEVYLDYREHDTKELPTDSWSELQGPAVLVWNDSVFSEKDFTGICELGLGSKKKESGTIGEYGIGFNVVYHLTDCPSFISNNQDFCFLDPRGKIYEGQTGGRIRLDAESENFLETFSHIKAPYLREGCTVPNKDIHQGTLFRFPLRKADSKISSRKPKIESIKNNIEQWIEEVKLSILFLLNLEEINFYTIDKNSCEMFASIRKTITQSEFTKEEIIKLLAIHGNPTCVPFAIELNSESNSEQWYIQHSKGHLLKDVDFGGSKLPLHSLAVPMYKKSTPKFQGRLCRFLPLPCQTTLPVHINGNFQLDTSRSNLGKTATGELSKHNQTLFDAIAASYTLLLEKLATLWNPAEFYKVIPHNAPQKSESEAIEKAVWEYLWDRRSCVIFACSGSQSKEIRHLPLNSNVFFVLKRQGTQPKKEKNSNLVDICMRLGMVIVKNAPKFFLESLSHRKPKQELCGCELTPLSLLGFMGQNQEQKPITPVAQSPFQSMEGLRTFLDFLYHVITKDTIPSIFGWNLLTGCDEMLKPRETTNKLLKCSLIPQELSGSPFLLHPMLEKFTYPDWCLSGEDDRQTLFLVLDKLCTAWFSQVLPATLTPVTFEDKDKIDRWWDFLFLHTLFDAAIPELLRKWSLIPLDTEEYCSLHSNIPIVASETETFRKVLRKFGILSVLPGSKAERILAKLDLLTKKDDYLQEMTKCTTPPSLDETEICLILKELRLSLNNVHLCKKLPIFCTTGGNYITLPEHQEAYTTRSKLDFNLPGLHFLDCEKAWYLLASSLKIPVITEEKMFDLLLASDLTLRPPQVVFNILLEIKKRNIVNSLSEHSSAKVIYVEDEACFFEVSRFVNHTMPFYSTFKEFFPKEIYLPPVYQSPDWEELMIKLGLGCEVHVAHMKEVCTTIIPSQKNFYAGEVGQDRLKAILDSLDKMESQHIPDFKKLTFLPAENEKFGALAPYVSTKPFLAIEGSCFPADAALCWTVRPVLSPLILEPSFLKKYGVKDISVKEVIQHLKHLVVALPVTGERKEELTAVLKKIFDYLRKENSLDFIFDENVPCLPVDIPGTQNMDLKPPSVVHKSINPVNELYPYLHHLSADYVQSFERVALLTPNQIQLLLQLVHEEVKVEGALNPNQMKIVLIAFKRLSKLLRQKQELSPDLPLYLLNAKRQLKDSISLKYNDEESAISCQDIDSVYNDEACKNLIQELPPQWKPKVVSELYNLRLSPNCLNVATVNQNVTSGLFSLLDKFIKKDAAKAEYVNGIKVYNVPNLILEREEEGTWVATPIIKQIYLQVDGTVAIYKTDTCKNRDCRWLGGQLLRDIKRRFDVSSKFDESNIVDMLEVKDQKELTLLLQELHLKATVELDMDWSKLGIEIPAAYHHTLFQELNQTFYPGELVGYKKDEAEFILAEFLCIISNDTTPFPMCIIRCTPDTETEVSILDIFKFSTQFFEPQNTLLNTEQPGSRSNNNDDLESLLTHLLELYETLLSLQKLDHETREKGFKRLFITWHPDKNSSKIATKVTQYLLQQIRNIRNGLPIEHPGFEAAHSDAPTRDDDFPEFREWHQNAKQYHADRKSNFSARPTQVPQPVKDRTKGLTWIKQAQEEEAVMNSLLSSMHYGYVVFMAHQVMEKSLKGGIYCLVGVSVCDDMLHSHRLSPLLYKLDLDLDVSPYFDEKNYLAPRYPNVWGDNVVPYEQYSREQAEKAAATATAVLRAIRAKVEKQ